MSRKETRPITRDAQETTRPIAQETTNTPTQIPLPTADCRLPTQLLWDFDLTPAIEAHLDALAHAGRCDPAARNELYRLLGGKIERFLAPWRGRPIALGEFADLRQEAFLVFAALVADWPGTGSFARYFLGFFGWRLRHAVEAHARRWPAERLVIIPEGSLIDALLDPDNPADPFLPLWPLSEDDRLLLALRLIGGYTVAEIAPLLGWSRRTAFRRWRDLVARLGPAAPARRRAS